MLRSSARRRQCPEADEFRFHVAPARMWRSIHHTVGGHYAVLTRSPDPVVPGVILSRNVEKLHATMPADQVTIGGLLAVAAMVMPRGSEISEIDKPFFHLAGANIAADIVLRPHPHEPARHQNVDGRPEACSAGALPA